MRRRNRAFAISIAPTPSDPVSDAFAAIEARRKLEVAIEDQKSKAEAAETEFAKTFARGLQLVQVVDADGAVQKNEARKAAEDRADKRIEALENILERVNKYLDRLKTESADAVNSALCKKVEALEKIKSERDYDQKDLDDQIKKLKAEISKLPKPAAKKTVSK